MSMLEEARTRLRNIIVNNGWNETEKIYIVSARDLTPVEAIGKPDRDDYPLLNGKEVMLESRFREAAGQAFTDQPGQFEGTLDDVLHMPLNTNFRRAVFVSTLNAVMRYLKQAEATIHCKDKEPALCAQKLPKYIRKHYGQPKIAFIGFQPAMIQVLSDEGFDLRATDLNPANVGQIRSGTYIYDANLNAEHTRWADIVLATGTILVNDTYRELQQGKPIIYYGVTVAGLAEMFNLTRICFYGH